MSYQRPICTQDGDSDATPGSDGPPELGCHPVRTWPALGVQYATSANLELICLTLSNPVQSCRGLPLLPAHTVRHGSTPGSFRAWQIRPRRARTTDQTFIYGTDEYPALVCVSSSCQSGSVPRRSAGPAAAQSLKLTDSHQNADQYGRPETVVQIHADQPKCRSTHRKVSLVGRLARY